MKNVLANVVGFLKDLFEILVRMYQISLGPLKRNHIQLKAHAIVSGITTVLTLGIISKVLMGPSMIRTGIIYFALSMEKRTILAWSSEFGWDPWLSDRYHSLTSFKEDFIATNNFARFLSNLASNGIILKIVQIAFMLFCFLCIFYMAYVAYKCISHLVWAIRNMPFEQEMIAEKRVINRRKSTAKAKVINIRSIRQKEEKAKIKTSSKTKKRA